MIERMPVMPEGSGTTETTVSEAGAFLDQAYPSNVLALTPDNRALVVLLMAQFAVKIARREINEIRRSVVRDVD
jgi:hypothetical protein